MLDPLPSLTYSLVTLAHTHSTTTILVSLQLLKHDSDAPSGSFHVLISAWNSLTWILHDLGPLSHSGHGSRVSSSVRLALTCDTVS